MAESSHASSLHFWSAVGAALVMTAGRPEHWQGSQGQETHAGSLSRDTGTTLQQNTTAHTLYHS